MEFYNNKMVRRQDRLLLETIAASVLKDNEYGILSMVENIDGESGGYGIPLNFVWDGNDKIYFHCAPEGHKLECLDKNPNVSFTIIGKTNVLADKFTTEYQSLVVRGIAKHNLSEKERLNALELFIDKYSPEHKAIGMKYAEKSFHRTEIIVLEIKSISGKAKSVAKAIPET